MKFTAVKAHTGVCLRLLVGLYFCQCVFAHASAPMEANAKPGLPAALVVSSQLQPPAAGITDIKFREFFKLPVGPRGLEPSEKLLGLNGKSVRIVGYMVNSESPQKGMFILSPLPVAIGDEDESLSDDLPPSVIFVHLSNIDHVIPFVPGLIKLSGTLQVGAQEETDGRVSAVRLQTDSATTRALLKIRPQHQARN